VRYDARSIDIGVREAVDLLNHVPGVRTRASCEGAGTERRRHTHATLAYVAFCHPLPLRLQDFLVAHLGVLARVEDDGVYCRWPMRNGTFLGALASVTRDYLRDAAHERCRSLRWPLARLRAQLARRVVRGHASAIGLCLTCAELVGEPSSHTHQPIPLLRLLPDLHDRWFAEFVAEPRNALEATLIETEGWVRLLARTQRGDFGAAFQRRWLRYRAQCLTDLTTREIRHGVEAARRQGLPIDFFHDGTHAVFIWT
jgi:hypothetical protein